MINDSTVSNIVKLINHPIMLFIMLLRVVIFIVESAETLIKLVLIVHKFYFTLIQLVTLNNITSIIAMYR